MGSVTLIRWAIAAVAALITGVSVYYGIEQRGVRKAEAKMEKATNNAISKAHSASAKSAAGRGVQNLKYRD